MRWFCDSWALVSGVTPISRATCCPEGRPIFLPRRRFRYESRFSALTVSGSAVGGILNSGSASEASNWRTGRAVRFTVPSVLSHGSLKNLLHWIFSRGGNGRGPFKLLSVGARLEQRHARDGDLLEGGVSVAGCSDVLDGVAGPGDAVAEAVCGHRELDRDERAPRGFVGL